MFVCFLFVYHLVPFLFRKPAHVIVFFFISPTNLTIVPVIVFRECLFCLFFRDPSPGSRGRKVSPEDRTSRETGALAAPRGTTPGQLGAATSSLDSFQSQRTHRNVQRPERHNNAKLLRLRGDISPVLRQIRPSEGDFQGPSSGPRPSRCGGQEG